MSTAGPDDRPVWGDRRAVAADSSWMLWLATGTGGVWVAVVLISLFAPDLVSGSEQEHLPIAAFITWFWGVVGTLVVLGAMSRLRGSPVGRPVWIGLTVVTLALWGAATIFAITLPVYETGTDPTRIPFGAIFSPVAAVMLTALAGFISIVFGRGPWSVQPDPRGYGP